MNATVNLQPDRLDVWVGTQDAGQALEMAARFSGLKPVAVVATDTYWRAKRAQAGVIFPLIDALRFDPSSARPRESGTQHWIPAFAGMCEE